MLRCSAKSLPFWLVGTCLLLLSSCMSDHELKGFYNQVFGDPMNLAASSSAFQAEYHHWPKDYAELSAFVQQSGWKPALGHYDRVEFKQLPSGDIEVCAINGTQTNKITVTEGSNAPPNVASEPGPHYNFTK